MGFLSHFPTSLIVIKRYFIPTFKTLSLGLWIGSGPEQALLLLHWPPSDPSQGRSTSSFTSTQHPPPRTPSTHTAGELRVQNGARRGTRRPVRLPPWGLSQSPWHGTLWNLRQGLPVSDQRFISGGCPQGESQTRKPTLKLPPPSCPLWGHQS